jgi:hypothetical protein
MSTARWKPSHRIIRMESSFCSSEGSPIQPTTSHVVCSIFANLHHQNFTNQSLFS